jgi:hypothetical protein
MTLSCKRSLEDPFLPPPQILKTTPTLPWDVWGVIFSYLPTYLDASGDVKRWSQVCRKFKEIALDSSDAVHRIFGAATPCDVPAFLKIYFLYKDPFVAFPECCERNVMNACGLTNGIFEERKKIHIVYSECVHKKPIEETILKVLEHIPQFSKLTVLGPINEDFYSAMMKNPPPFIHIKYYKYCGLRVAPFLNLAKPIHLAITINTDSPIDFSLIRSFLDVPQVKNFSIECFRFFEGKLLRLVSTRKCTVDKVKVNNDDYYGQLQHLIPHGQGTLNRNGKVVFKGFFVEGLPYEGEGLIEFHGYSFSGLFKEGSFKKGRITAPEGYVVDI